MRLPRIRTGRSQSFFRLRAPPVEGGLFGWIGDRYQHKLLKCRLTQGFSRLAFHVSHTVTTRDNGNSPFSTSFPALLKEPDLHGVPAYAGKRTPQLKAAGQKSLSTLNVGVGSSFP